MRTASRNIACGTVVQLLAVFLLSLFSPAIFTSVSAAKDESQQMYNIVLFAQFDSLSSGNFMEDRTDTIVSMCNDTNTYRSLSRYIDTISYGKTQVTSFFPQMEDGVIVPYVFSTTTADSGYMQLAMEMLRNIPVPEDIPLDGNEDGAVDNVSFVIEGNAADPNAPLWPKAFSLSGMEYGGCAVNMANLHNSKMLFEDIISGGIGVLCHEFLHTLGYPDLYRRENTTGVPVGKWDIMSDNSIFLQYPLAYQRASISGWLDAQEITEDGTYTLSPVSSQDGTRLYLLKSPLSDTEFFAVEYRKQGTAYSDELDVKIYGSGLVVYRVDTTQDGNYKGNRDEIYVFRPDETALDAGEGTIAASCYGGEAALDHVGSNDLDATVTDGALVYSNGMNSGIALTDISMDGDALTFTVSFADIEGQIFWERVESQQLGSKTLSQMTTSESATTYLLAAEEGQVTLCMIADGNLITVGTPLGSGTYMDMNEPKLTFCGDTPYVLYHDRDYALHLCRYDADMDLWAEVYQGTDLAQYAALTAAEDKVYFAYTTGSNPYALHAVCYDSKTESVTPLGDTIAENACNFSIVVVGGEPMITYRDLSDGNKPKLAIYQENTWDVLTISDAACGMVSAVSDGDTVWIAPSGMTGTANTVYTYSNGTVTSYSLPETFAASAYLLVPTLADGQFYVAVQTQNPSELVVYHYDGTTWEQVGNQLANELTHTISLTSDTHNLYCIYHTENSKSIRKIQLSATLPDAPEIPTEPELVSGDVNADGCLTAADLVMFQKWLLGDGTMTEPQAGDLFADGMINVFDLVMLRQILWKV